MLSNRDCRNSKNIFLTCFAPTEVKDIPLLSNICHVAGWQGDAVSEPAVWGGARPGLAWLQSADGASQGRSVTRDSETPGLTLIHHTRGHLVFRFFLSKKFTRNHQDGKRLRYIKLHSDLTFPEQHLSCMCLFNLTFFSWTFVFLSFKILHVIIVHWVCLIKSLYWLHRTYYYYDYHYYMSLYSQHIF